MPSAAPTSLLAILATRRAITAPNGAALASSWAGGAAALGWAPEQLLGRVLEREEPWGRARVALSFWLQPREALQERVDALRGLLGVSRARLAPLLRVAPGLLQYSPQTLCVGGRGGGVMGPPGGSTAEAPRPQRGLSPSQGSSGRA
jgi:hypothetical protein